MGANSLNSIKHEPFDGIVYPYSSAIDWVALSESERNLSYSEIPSSKKLPPIQYNPAELALPLSELGFSSKNDVKVRNAKITYSVPYLGNYELDGVEGAGSHPAVDIKLPIGTPIFSIMNGVVIKAEDQPWGFGKHVVIRHNNVPSFNNKSELTSYFSSYSHLSSFSVKVGDVVKKGQTIGLSGDSGTATTPHLHFQIDTEDAPWYPYWPFSINEAQSAGMSVFEAINAGLGQSQARRLTINPLKYIQNVFGVKNSIIADAEVDVDDKLQNEDLTDLPTKKNDNNVAIEYVLEEKPVTTVIDSKIADEIDLNVSPVVLLGQPSNVELRLNSTLSNSFASAEFDDVKLDSNLKISSSAPVVANSDAKTLLLPFVPKETGFMNLKIRINGEEFSTGNLEVRTFADITPNDVDSQVFLYLKNRGVFSGDQANNLNPSNNVNRAEAVKIILESLKSVRFEVVRSDASFVDVNPNEWHADYISRAFRYGIVNGISQSEFRPNNSLRLAEFLKMYFNALKIDVDPSVNDSYATYFDVNEWYAKYLVEAINRNIIDAQFASKPDRLMTRRDVAQVVYKVLKMIENGQDKFSY